MATVDKSGQELSLQQTLFRSGKVARVEIEDGMLMQLYLVTGTMNPDHTLLFVEHWAELNKSTCLH